MCNKFYLFEPITTMVLISLCSIVHVVRVHAIYDKSRAILGGLGAVLLVQVSLPYLSHILRSTQPNPTDFFAFRILDHFATLPPERLECLALGYPPTRSLSGPLVRVSDQRSHTLHPPYSFPLSHPFHY